ncbi:hypothetical protein EVAR_100500_1 [Eumeta japonica]|uniref:Uncharacterized protein n=1 Tax=Eumeta variegata TaxID=151549 RepID=A0A4C2A0Q9_EUMVA|nr:hypothetical protein EVAR_100500_1 [Eumeta japonica]
METMYDHYDEIQLQLGCKDDMDARLSERNDFESIYYKALSKVHGMLTDYSKSTEQANSASSRINLINYLQFNWLEFRDTFNTLIHSNDDIDKINKFHYLRASLGETDAVVVTILTKFIRKNLESTLTSAQMFLRKWRSNKCQRTSEPNQDCVDLNIGVADPSKTLGLSWNVLTNELFVPICATKANNNTKRSMLSLMSQVFDPLGSLAPCVIMMKMLLQQFWLNKISWDEQLPADVAKLWSDIMNKLRALHNLRVRRHVVCESYSFIDLHIFTDASKVAYGTCSYVRSGDHSGNIQVRLLLVKSLVAPLKLTTIPRVELCGALVGACLYAKIVGSLRAQVRQVILWIDSTTVLSWLKMHPAKLQPFFRNRVAKILEKIRNYTWRHVPTNENLADHISREVDSKTINGFDLWWSGPIYLRCEVSEWPSNHKPSILYQRLNLKLFYMQL